MVIPNMDYPLKIAIELRCLLTHGHADAIGALPLSLAETKVPVFGSEPTRAS